MNTRVVIGIFSFCVAMTGVVAGNVLLTVMIGEINRKRHGGDLISYFGFTFPEVMRILAEYRATYPRGHTHIYFWAAVAAMVIGMISAGICARVIG